MASAADALYGPDYYRSHCGSIPYDRTHPHWQQFFGNVADELVRVFRPVRVFDAGCAHGFLLEALWDRGVETWGRDISAFAITQVRDDVRPFCAAGSIAEPIGGAYDLITCIEVLEHMPEDEGAQAIAVMAAAAQRIVFSSSPTDLTEPTHVNVKPPIYWLRAFARVNFHPAIGITLPSITPYTLVLERRDTPPTDEFLLACAEIIRARMKITADYHAHGALTAEIAAQRQAIAAKEEAIAANKAAAAHQEATHAEQAAQLVAQLAGQHAALEAAQAALARQTAALEQAQQNVAAREADLAHATRRLTEQHAAHAEQETVVAALGERIASIEAAADLQRDDLVRQIAAQEAARNEEAEASRAEIAALLDHARSLEATTRYYRNAFDTVIASTTWRATSALRSAAGTLPRPVRRRLRQAAQLVYWTMTLQLAHRFRQRRAPLPALAPPSAAAMSQAAKTAIQAPPTAEPAATPLPPWFDAAYYLQTYPDVAAIGVDPLAHYLAHGRAEGRYPSAQSAQDAIAFCLADLCNPERDEPGPRAFDAKFQVSVLTPVYNLAPRYLRALYQTLRNQLYANWEWVVVDDGSTLPETVNTLRQLAHADARLKLTLSPENRGISGASNLALAAVGGTHVALVDHDDLLSRDAFLALHAAWQEAPDTQLFYTDECKLLPDGSLGQFWPKPDWSPAYLENTMCLGHLSVYETGFLRSLGGFRTAFDGTQDYDLALRASLAQPRVKHLPIFAYIWRIIPGSAAADLNEKHYAIERQGRAVQEYAERKHPGAKVVPGFMAGYWRIEYPLPEPAPLLSYVIPTGGGSRMVRGARVDLLANCIRSFEQKNFYPNREYVVVHNGDLDPAQEQALAGIPGVRMVHYAAARFNFSEKLNLGAAAAGGEYLCLLNDDVEAITPEGGRAIVSYLAANAEVGAIGPLCLREDGTIQQNGIILSSNGPAHAGDGQAAHFGGHQSMLNCRRESFCVGGAVMFVRKSVYAALGGFDEALPLNYNDVDFGVRLRDRRLSCVIDPYVRVHHFEGATKEGTSTVEQERFFLKHPGIVDPFFNQWFAQDEATYRLDLRGSRAAQPFGAWLDRHIADRARALVPAGTPLLSVCVSVYNQPRRLLEEMYTSVLMQTYPHKEFVILDNGSSNPETLRWLDRIRGEGQAVIERAEVNLGIEGGNRRLLDRMTGDYFVAMDADDFLSVDALQVLAHAIGEHPGRKVFYTDEYKSDMNSSRFAPFFKPDFDPILLMNCCYPAHLMAMEAAFLREVGAYTESRAAWSHDYDTLTRGLAVGEEPVHVRALVYGWRINPGSTASAETSAKPETTESQRFALERLLKARGLTGTLGVEPNRLETSSGMWRLKAQRPVDGVCRLAAEAVWGAGGMGVAGLVAAAEGAAWVAILVDGADEDALLGLSAPAWLDPRVVAVGGVMVEASGMVRWSGGLFLPGGSLFDPYAGMPLSQGGYHGQLWCQRCVDVVAPVQVLIRSVALVAAAGRAGGETADGLMVNLGLLAHEAADFVAVTPHVRAAPPPSRLNWLPMDRAQRLQGLAALEKGSRWFNGRLGTEPAYSLPKAM